MGKDLKHPLRLLFRDTTSQSVIEISRPFFLALSLLNLAEGKNVWVGFRIPANPYVQHLTDSFTHHRNRGQTSLNVGVKGSILKMKRHKKELCVSVSSKFGKRKRTKILETLTDPKASMHDQDQL